MTFDWREEKKRETEREREGKKSNYIRSPVVIGPQAAHSHSPRSLIHRESRSRVNSRAKEGEGREISVSPSLVDGQRSRNENCGEKREKEKKERGKGGGRGTSEAESSGELINASTGRYL